MAYYQLPGETITSVFPARVEITEFHGVEITSILGSEEQVRETTNMLDEMYPDDDKRALGDAKFFGYGFPVGGPSRPLYELIVLRKVTK